MFLSGSHLCVRMGYTPPWAINEKKEVEERVDVSESERESKVDWKMKERVRKEDKGGDLYFFSFFRSRGNWSLLPFYFCSLKVMPCNLWFFFDV